MKQIIILHAISSRVIKISFILRQERRQEFKERSSSEATFRVIY